MKRRGFIKSVLIGLAAAPVVVKAATAEKVDTHAVRRYYPGKQSIKFTAGEMNPALAERVDHLYGRCPSLEYGLAHAKCMNALQDDAIMRAMLSTSI